MSDLIRRRDAVSRMSDLLMIELKGQRLPTWNEVYQAMNDVPSAETKRKGKWETVLYKKIEHGEVVIVGDAQRCSVCRHAEKGWNKEMKYCPNCGADMRGE